MMRRRIAAGVLILLLLVIAGCGTEQITSNSERQVSPPQITTEDSLLHAQPIPVGHEQGNAVTEEVEIPTQGEEAEPVAITSENSFLLYLSRDFGRETLDSRQVKLNTADSLLDYMQEEWQISTGFGGGFVQGIDGLESANRTGKRSDWFFYVNGVGSPVGADQIKPSPGSVVWWDYHLWYSGPGQSAVIGCYPQPLKNSGVIILTTQRWMQLALQCQEAMGISGIYPVEIADLSQNTSLLDRPTAPVMVIGPWTDLQENSYLKKWNEAYRRNGSSIHFTADGIDLLGTDGKVQQTLGEGTGVIVASSPGLGDNNPMWLIAGVDDQGVKEAARILCSKPDDLRWKYGLVVQEGQIMALPAD